MKISTDLFQLIQSLTPSEKRYFRMFSAGRTSRAGGQGYLVIFDAVDRMETYDEKALLESLDDPQLVKQFPVLKNYLYRLLLKSLRNFHSEQSVDFQIKELLLNCELLSDRGLVEQAQKQVAKAEKLAVEYERFVSLAEIGSLRISLAIRMGQGNLKEVEDRILRIYRDTSTHFENYQLMERYRVLSLRLLLTNRKEAVIRGPESRRIYNDLITDPLLADAPPRFSIKARLFYYQSHFIYQIARGDFAKSFRVGSDMVELLEGNPWVIAERPENYIAALQNVAAAATYTEPTYIVRELLENLRNVEERFPKIKFPSASIQQLSLLTYHIEFQMLVQRGEYEVAERIIPEARTVVDAEHQPKNINEGFLRIGVLLQFILVYLHLRQLEPALEYCEQIISDETVNEDYEIHLISRLFRVLILFELGAESRLDSAMMSLYRFLKKKDKLYDFEKALFNFVRRATKEPTKLRREMELLRDEMQVLKEKNGPYATLMGYDLVQWLQERIDELSVSIGKS